MAYHGEGQQATAVFSPPGLTPPGLEMPLEPPPGLAPPPGLSGIDRASPSPMYVSGSLTKPAIKLAQGPTVRIANLPNHLMTKAMMEVTLEQANLDKFVSDIRTVRGAQRGEAFITLTSTDAAIRCARHFNGRRWDASGALVIAELQLLEVAPAQPSFAFSSAAAEFVPGSTKTCKNGAWQKQTPTHKKSSTNKINSHRRSGSASTSAIGSDVSTTDGSSSSDEK
jgi:hypothetical protein